MKRNKLKTSDRQRVGSVTGERAPKDRMRSRVKTRFFAVGRTVLIFWDLYIRFLCPGTAAPAAGSPIGRTMGAAPVKCVRHLELLKVLSGLLLNIFLKTS